MIEPLGKFRVISFARCGCCVLPRTVTGLTRGETKSKGFWAKKLGKEFVPEDSTERQGGELIAAEKQWNLKSKRKEDACSELGP